MASVVVVVGGGGGGGGVNSSVRSDTVLSLTMSQEMMGKKEMGRGFLIRDQIR